MTKSELRKDMMMKRSAMTSEEVMERSLKIIYRIKQDLRYQQAKVIALFYPMGHEVNLLSLLEDQTKEFRFPRVEKDGIHFYTYHKNIAFVRSSFGVMEPPKGVYQDEGIDYMIAPALAISNDLYRLGYGKGYYDQFLIKSRPNVVVGVIFSFQRLEDVPHDDYDQKLDDIIEG
jgi:5-formyltetrahydrofolate cyclo-ligase